VFPAKVRQHFEGFDFIDLSLAQTMLLSVGDVAIIAVFNDSQAALSVALEDLQRKIGGPLSPIQLREVAARFASINLHVEPRPLFFSQIDTSAGTYNIGAERPDQVHMSAWNLELHGRIMQALAKDSSPSVRKSTALMVIHRSLRNSFIGWPLKVGQHSCLTIPTVRR